jgi:hypothetical protein
MASIYSPAAAFQKIPFGSSVQRDAEAREMLANCK